MISKHRLSLFADYKNEKTLRAYRIYRLPLYGGCFFLIGADGLPYSLTKCRETFESRMASFTGWDIGFWLERLPAKRIDEVISLAEIHLGLNIKTIIHRSGKRDIIIIKPSPWWKETRIRREVFTLLIRLGALHYKGDWVKALASYSLTSGIMPAVLARFLSGYTHLRTSGRLKMGIYDFFSSKEAKSIPYWLTKEPAIQPKKVT